MNSDRGWYLVAVGVLALGISNSSIGNLSISDSVRGFLDRGVAVADNLSAEAMRAFPNPPGACASEDRCETGCVDQGAFMVCDRHSASGHRRIVFTRRWRLGRRRPPITSSACLDSVVWNCCLPVQKIRKFFYLNSRKAVIVVSLAIP